MYRIQIEYKDDTIVIDHAESIHLLFGAIDFHRGVQRIVITRLLTVDRLQLSLPLD